MDVTGINSVAGMGGLYQVVAQTRTGLLVESLVDGKRVPVYASNKVSSLEDISIYGNSEDIPLKEILTAIRDKNNAQPLEADQKDLKAAFAGFVPEYAQERVYASDMKKVFGWYNLLLSKDLLIDAPEAEQKAEDGDDKPKAEIPAAKKTAAVKKETPKTSAPKASSKGMAKTQTVRKTGG